MKKMTCRDMGGPCDMEFVAKSPDEMMKMGEEHVKKMHPEMAADMGSISAEENKKMHDDFMKKWSRTPDMK